MKNINNSSASSLNLFIIPPFLMNFNVIFFGIALIFVSASVVFFGEVVGYLMIAASAAMVAGLLFFLNKSDSQIFVFAVVFVFPLVVGFLKQVTGVSLVGFWQVLIMFFSLFGIKYFRREASQEALLRIFLWLLFVFLSLALISSFLGRSHFYSALFQFVSDFKPLSLLILGYMLSWNSRMEGFLLFVVRWLWLPAIIMVALEWVAPSVYFKIFSYGYGRFSIDPSGVFPSRASGFFDHPSILATVSATFSIFSMARFLMLREKRIGNLLLAIIYFLLVLFAVQRQELAACVTAALLLFLIVKPERMAFRLVIVAILFVFSTTIFLTIFADTIARESVLWGVGTIGKVEHPRAQIYSGAWLLAHQYFPFGSGLGTFAGAGAEKFDTSLYDYLGFRNYWWYGRENYLMDTYWPNSISESGFLGSTALLASYVFLFFYAIKSCWREYTKAKYYWAATAAMMGYMLLLSISSPAFQDMRLFVFPALMFGFSTKLSKSKCDDLPS